MWGRVNIVGHAYGYNFVAPLTETEHITEPYNSVLFLQTRKFIKSGVTLQTMGSKKVGFFFFFSKIQEQKFSQFKRKFSPS